LAIYDLDQLQAAAACKPIV